MLKAVVRYHGCEGPVRERQRCREELPRLIGLQMLNEISQVTARLAARWRRRLEANPLDTDWLQPVIAGLTTVQKTLSQTGEPDRNSA